MRKRLKVESLRVTGGGLELNCSRGSQMGVVQIGGQLAVDITFMA